MSKVFVKVIQQTGPNGDRDRERHPYQDYEVHLLDDDEQPSEPTLIHAVSGYDNFNSHILDKDAVKADALGRAKRLADKLKVKIEVQGIDVQMYFVIASASFLASNPEEALRMYKAKRVEPTVQKL